MTTDYRHGHAAVYHLLARFLWDELQASQDSLVLPPGGYEQRTREAAEYIRQQLHAHPPAPVLDYAEFVRGVGDALDEFCAFLSPKKRLETDEGVG